MISHTESIEAIRVCHAELLEAKIRLVEAASDVESLQARNSAVIQNIEREKQVGRDIEQELKTLKENAKGVIAMVKKLLSEANEEDAAYLQSIPEDVTIEECEAKIMTEEARLEYTHATNPNAIRDFENRKADLEKLQEKMAAAEDRLGKLSRRITKLRDRWEPALDALIAEISDAFSHNFEQIGCAGEICVHKDDDFDQWAIQIKVKFRYVLKYSAINLPNNY